MRLRQTWLFYPLSWVLAGLLAWLSLQSPRTYDWTDQQQHQLAPKTVALLAEIKDPVHIMSFATPSVAVRDYIQTLINKFQVHKQNLTFEFINPELAPEKARSLNITREGELVIHYNHRIRHLSVIREANIIDRLVNMHQTQPHWIGYLSGHGERSPYSKAKADMSVLHQALKQLNIQAISLNLAHLSDIPDNVSVLLLASPAQAYAPAEIHKIQRYLNQGGHFLWLAEPAQTAPLKALASTLSLQFLPGQVIDLNSQRFKTQSTGKVPPTFCFIQDYVAPDVLKAQRMTLLPGAVSIQAEKTWRAVLSTDANSWTETSQIEGDIQYNAALGEIAGPLVLGVVKETASGQRMAVIGDGDFLSNRYIGHGSNLEIATQLIRWLMPEKTLALNNPIGPEHQLVLSNQTIALLAFSLFVFLPGVFVLMGLWIGWHRRRFA